MDFAPLQTPGAAFVAGLVTSLHCAGMCGPVACWLMPTQKQDDATTISSVYQVTRLLSYTLLGVAAGGLGRVPLTFLGGTWLQYTPWILVIFFVAVAFKLDKRIPRPLWSARLAVKLHSTLRGRSRLAGAAILGAGTPLLPCGPLYFVIAMATFAGSALRGAEFMLAFGLGTLPLLWFTQANFGLLRSKLKPAVLDRTRAGIAVVAALVVTWRLRGTVGFAGPDPTSWVCF